MSTDTRPTHDIVSDLRLALRIGMVGGVALPQYLKDAIERLELLDTQAEHYARWFGTECPCDDEDCPL